MKLEKSSIDEIKHTVLDRISASERWYTAGHAKYRIGSYVVHVRFCSTDRFGSPHYKFNINPNTLRADFEVWICGGSDTYYIIPIRLIREIYENPETYIDSRHPEIRVVSINVDTNSVTYARGGKFMDIGCYLCGTL